MSKPQTLEQKSFVTRDTTIQRKKNPASFFFRGKYHFPRKKKDAEIFFHWIAISRVTNVPAERNSFPSVIQLQGSAGAERPTDGTAVIELCNANESRQQVDVNHCKAEDGRIFTALTIAEQGGIHGDHDDGTAFQRFV